MRSGVESLVHQGVVALGVSCRQGLHRSSVVARAIVDVANQLQASDGRRLLNAMHHKTAFLQRPGEIDRFIEHLSRWHRDPWCVVAGGPLPRSLRFGYQACLQHPDASGNWTYLQDWAENSFWMVPDESTVGDRTSAAEPTPKSAPIPPPPERATPRPPATPPPARVNPMPPATPPPTSLSSAAPRPSAAPPSTVAHRSSTDIRVSQPTTPPAALAPNPATSSSATSSGAVGSRKRERWETFERNVEVWSEVLDESGIDRTSRQELFLLAQLSDAGYERANDVISKVLKKNADSEPLRNPSAFVHRSVLNARHELNSR